MNPNHLVTCEIDSLGIAHVRLNRPAQMNALNGAMFDAILEVAERLATLGVDELRAVVLSGEGRAFCAGLDVGNFQLLMQGQGGTLDLGQRCAGAAKDLVARTHGIANGPQQVVWAWRQLPVPVVAVLHGPVLGAGLQLALAADLRIAAPDARLAVKEMHWGLVPDMAGMVLLRELIGADAVRELVYTARELSGEQALARGLVSHVSADPQALAQSLAAEIAQQSPQAIRAAKRLINLAFDGASPAQVLLAEAQEQQPIIGSAEQVETVMARLQRRAPSYVRGQS